MPWKTIGILTLTCLVFEAMLVFISIAGLKS